MEPNGAERMHMENLNNLRSQAPEENIDQTGFGSESEDAVNDENYDSEQAGSEPIPTAHFPFIMLFIAVIKDISDIIPFAGFFTTPFFYFCVLIWFLLKDGRIQGLTGLKTAAKSATALFVDFIPGVDLFPEATLLILLVYLSERASVEKIKKGSIAGA